MHFLQLFAGPVCILNIPSERMAFFILLQLAVFVALGLFVQFKLFDSMRARLALKTSSHTLYKGILITTLSVVTLILIGIALGSSEVQGSCNDGVWSRPMAFFWVYCAVIVLIALLYSVVVFFGNIGRLLTAKTPTAPARRHKFLLLWILGGLTATIISWFNGYYIPLVGPPTLFILVGTAVGAVVIVKKQ